MSEKIWSDDAWEDYLYWQSQDKKNIRRINQLIKIFNLTTACFFRRTAYFTYSSGKGAS